MFYFILFYGKHNISNVNNILKNESNPVTQNIQLLPYLNNYREKLNALKHFFILKLRT